MLTDAALKNLKPKDKVYKVTDRDGMYVRVGTNGTISFRYDYRMHGRRETVTFGKYCASGLSLARAREKCIDAKRMIQEGLSPAIEKQRDKRRIKEAKSFGEFGDKWLSAGLMADSMRAMRRSIFERELVPHWRNRLLTEITPGDLLDVVGQVLTQEQHKHFGTRWGEIHCHPVRLAQGVPNPEITVVRNDSTSLVAIGEGWHSDSTFEERPPMGSLLYMKQMPETGVGGDTLFANMCLAYDTLSPTMQTFLDGLTALHNGEVLSRLYNFPVPPGGYPETRHPLVARHPETGRKILYVNPSFTARIPELSQTESTALLDMLYRHVESSPAIVCRVGWSDNSLVFWDNRCTQHHAIFDYAPHAREGERVTVLGERPHA